MTSARLALVVGALLWVAGTWVPTVGKLSRSRRQVDYWWAATATSTGILGGLLTFDGFRASAEQSTIFRALPLAFFGLLLLARYWHEGLVVPGAGVALALLFAILLSFGAGGEPAFFSLLSFLLYAPAMVVPKHGYDLTALRDGLAAGTGAALLILVGFAIASPDMIYGECRADKCSMWGVSLGGRAGNALGLALAMASAMTMLSVRRPLSLALVAIGSYLLVDLTSSRSAMYGWYMGCVTVVAYLLTNWRRSRAFVGVAAAVAGLAVIIVPFLSWRGDAFSGRAVLWHHARDLFLTNPLFGYGSSFWVSGESSAGISPNYSTHNLAMELLVSSGLVGSLAFLFALILAARGRGSFRQSAYTLALMGATLGLSITEVLSAPGRVYLVAGAIVLVFMTSQASEARGVDQNAWTAKETSRGTPLATARR